MTANTTLKSDQATRYLLDKDWIILPTMRDDVICFGAKDPRDLTWLCIPKYDSSTYWGGRMLQQTSAVLSMVEKRPVKDVLDDLLNPLSDKISFRIKSVFAKFGSVPLSSFNKLFSGVTGILKSAVKDIETPEKEHKRLWGKSIKKLMDSAQFGQTKKGSFVFNIYIPVVEDNELNVYRTALIHILDSFACLTDRKCNRKASMNLYQSLCQMDLWEDAVVDIAVKWSPLFPASEHIRTKVRLSRDAVWLAKKEVCR